MADGAAVARLHVTAAARRQGFLVEEASTAEACLKRLAGADVAVVVCDPLLARDGPGFVRRILERSPGAAVVVHTADTRPQTVRALVRAGAVDVVAKPAEEERLVRALRRALERWGGGGR